MKKFTFLFLIFANSLFSQSLTWNEFSSNCESTDYEVIEVTYNNYMVAEIPEIWTFFVSVDQGQSWRQLINDVGTRYTRSISAADEPELYFIVDWQKIFKYDPVSDQTELFHDQSQFGSLNEAILLENGNFLTAGRSTFSTPYSNNIHYFDDSGNLLNTLELDSSFDKIEFLYEAGQPTYLTYTYGSNPIKREIRTLDVENLALGEAILIPNSGSGLKYSNGRLFISNLYSLDGGASWMEHNSTQSIGIPRSIDVFNNNVVMIDETYLHFSTDQGETFNGIEHGIETYYNINLAFFENGNSLFLLNQWSDGPVYFTEDKGETYIDFIESTDISLSYGIAVSNQDNILINSTSCGLGFFVNDVRNEVDGFSEDRGMYLFRAIPNGNFIGIEDDKIILSNNTAQDWDLKIMDLFEVGNITIKEGVIYVSHWQTIPISNDDGVSFTIIDKPDNISLRLDRSDYFFDSRIIFYDRDGNLLIHDLIDSTDLMIDKELNVDLHLDIATDWTGNGFHILEYSDLTQDEFLIYSSNNEGQDFTAKNIPFAPIGYNHQMLTDNIGNIIVYSTEQILVTQDQGETWFDLSPDNPNIWSVTDITVSYDHYLYASTIGTGALKFECPLNIDLNDCPILTSIDEPLGNTQVRIFPNPASDIINIELEEELEYEWDLYNVQGQLVVSGKNLSTVPIDLIESGIYVLQMILSESGQKTSKKIVVGK